MVGPTNRKPRARRSFGQGQGRRREGRQVGHRRVERPAGRAAAARSGRGSRRSHPVAAVESADTRARCRSWPRSWRGCGRCPRSAMRRAIVGRVECRPRCAGSKPSKARRKARRLRRMVDHDRPGLEGTPGRGARRARCHRGPGRPTPRRGSGPWPRRWRSPLHAAARPRPRRRRRSARLMVPGSVVSSRPLEARRGWSDGPIGDRIVADSRRPGPASARRHGVAQAADDGSRAPMTMSTTGQTY